MKKWWLLWCYVVEVVLECMALMVDQVALWQFTF